jgi:[CysO sulfur-carrier protein]-S-L-cysteine hydrolase
MLAITKADLQSIFDHCNRAYPNEACGILARARGRVERVYHMANVDPGPAQYLMEPQEQFRVMREMRHAGLELAGIYHSHIVSPAYPSATDIDLAYYPEAVYLIVSLLDRNIPEVRAYTIVRRDVSEVSLTVV